MEPGDAEGLEIFVALSPPVGLHAKSRSTSKVIDQLPMEKALLPKSRCANNRQVPFRSPTNDDSKGFVWVNGPGAGASKVPPVGAYVPDASWNEAAPSSNT